MKLRKELSALTRANADLYIFLGGPRIPLRDVEEVLKKPFYIVTGKYDDIYVAKSTRATGRSLDAHVITLDQYTLAGINGVDPHYCISRVAELLHSMSSSNVLIFSCMPALGYCDTVDRLNIRVGLPELTEFISNVKPRLFVSLGSRDCVEFYGSTQLAVMSKHTKHLDVDLNPLDLPSHNPGVFTV
ncbi:MAG: hypothetical protein QXS42_05950 [Zestosphaera sp.]